MDNVLCLKVLYPLAECCKSNLVCYPLKDEFYYMAGNPTGQDGPISPARDCPRSHKSEIIWYNYLAIIKIIISPLLTKLVRSRWLDIGLVLFFVFMHLDFVSVRKNEKELKSVFFLALTVYHRPISMHVCGF